MNDPQVLNIVQSTATQLNKNVLNSIKAIFFEEAFLLIWSLEAPVGSHDVAIRI